MPALREHIAAASERYSSDFKYNVFASPLSNQFIFVTCMNSRIDTSQAFEIGVGEGHVICNAGGSAADALRSIVISSLLLETREIAVIKHTKCGMDGLTNELVHSTILANLGIEAIADVNIKNMADFVPFVGAAQSMAEDVKLLKSSPLIQKDIEVTGWIYNVETGSTTRVV